MQTQFFQPPHTRLRPGRRWNNSYNTRFTLVHTLALSLLVLISLCGSIHAADAGARPPRTQKITGRFARGDIIFDDRQAPEPAIYRRVEASSIPAPAETDTANNSSASTSTSSGSGPTPTSIESAPTDSTSPLPTPFDGGLGTNYTQPSCPIFLKNMINSNTLISCRAFSLLLQNSMSFFSATKSLSHISETLHASCNIDFHSCSNIMSSYALTLRSSTACEQDYERQQPLVRQAYAGLLSYDVLYNASCLKSQASSEQNDDNYCFANAVTNVSSPTDSYVYYLPLGIPLPSGSLPTCDGCLKEVMGVFAAAASNRSQPLSLDYVNAAQQINQDCGPNFVNGTVPKVGASGSGQTSSAPPQAYCLGWGLAVVLLTVMFLGL